jgi:ABC-type branched-subunit amino acid transport system ATPase component
MEPVLEARNVSVSFGGNAALLDVSIELRKGEVLGILGPNGAGKTTLFDALTGQVKPDSGSVVLKHADVTPLRPEERAELGLGRTFQQARLFDDLTLFECLQVALERGEPTEALPSLLGLPPSRIAERTKRTRAAELIEMFGLEPYANRPMTALSTGTRRMAELASIVALGADVVLLDEPTAGVAQAEVERFTPVIREVAAHLGASLVIIEHDIPLMMSLVDRLYVLVAGKVITEGLPVDVATDPAVVASYLGTDKRVVHRPGRGQTDLTAGHPGSGNRAVANGASRSPRPLVASRREGQSPRNPPSSPRRTGA